MRRKNVMSRDWIFCMRHSTYFVCLSLWEYQITWDVTQKPNLYSDAKLVFRFCHTTEVFRQIVFSFFKLKEIFSKLKEILLHDRSFGAGCFLIWMCSSRLSLPFLSLCPPVKGLRTGCFLISFLHSSKCGFHHLSFH